jgi:hypothetical protein
MRKGLGELIIKDITLKGVLHIKSNSVIDIRLVKDSSKGIVFYNLIVQCIASRATPKRAFSIKK